jgi:hypothetical protein
VKLTWPQAIARRARRHHLHERAPRAAMLDVASDLVGLHAQLMSSAELTLWARVEDLEPDAVQRALWEERTLVKLWAMRGTLHLAPAREYPLWRAALATYVHWRKPAWRRYFGVEEDELDALVAATGQALEDRELTREELASEVIRITGSAHLAEVLGESWGALLKPPSFQGLLCFAPGDGQRVRFTHPVTWLESAEAAEAEDPLSELVRRYVATNGPLTREDVARWWAGATPAQAERILERVGAARVDVEGDPAWMLPEDADPEPPVRSVRLLPAFDQYVVAATRHAHRLLPDPALKARVYRSQGWLTPVLCVDGRMDGVWRHQRKGRRLTVEIEPFGKPAKRVRTEAEREAERLAKFLGGEFELTWLE